MPYDSTYMQNLKYNTNEPIYKTQMDSKVKRTDLWLPRVREGGEGDGMDLGLADANYYIQHGLKASSIL